MANPELAFPPESITESLTFDVSDILADVDWQTRPESGFDLREKQVSLGHQRKVGIRQIRVPDSPFPIIVSSVRLEMADSMSLARWQSDQTQLLINDFTYTDDLKMLLSEVNDAM